MLAVRIECDHAIAHAARSGESAVFKCENVNQCVSIDVVEVVAVWNVGIVVQKKRCEVCVFTIEVNDVGNEVSLL